MFSGTVIAIGTVVSWVCKTQFSQSMYSPDFDAPVLITWISKIWMVLVFPIYSLLGLL